MFLPKLSEVYVSSDLATILKGIGYAGGAVAVVYGGIKWMVGVIKKLGGIADNVSLVMTNHLPHIQASLEEHSQTLSSIRSDVRDMDTKMNGAVQRIEDTKSGLRMLSESFIRHVENAASDRIELRAQNAQNTVKIAGIEAAVVKNKADGGSGAVQV